MIDKARRLHRTLSARLPDKPIFRRQHPLGPYVLDFYCTTAHLAIEIDGISHDMGERPALDQRRNAWLKHQGVTVVRLPAAELMQDVDAMADAIIQMASEKR